MIYLDNSATTPIHPEVKEAMLPFLEHEFGNPSSKYYPQAITAQKAVQEAREHIAALINASPDEIIFTAGASESNNMIIKGIADFEKYYGIGKNHLISSPTEHESVLSAFKFLNGEIYSNKDINLTFGQNPKIDRGYTVSFAPVNEYGQVLPSTLTELITDQTSLVSLMWGNNEIGSLNDIPTLGSLCKEKGVFFHSDATQALGKIAIDVTTTSVDALSFSAHKLYGPKGIGALYLRQNAYGLKPQFTSLIHGGEQENGLRAGTLAVHNIVGFGKAAEIAKREFDSNVKKLISLEAELKKGLKEALPEIEFLGDPEHKVPGIISVVMPSKMFNNEFFIRKVSDKIAISTGSACSAGKPSHVLQSINHSTILRKVLRVSISHATSSNDLSYFVNLF